MHEDDPPQQRHPQDPPSTGPGGRAREDASAAHQGPADQRDEDGPPPPPSDQFGRPTGEGAGHDPERAVHDSGPADAGDDPYLYPARVGPLPPPDPQGALTGSVPGHAPPPPVPPAGGHQQGQFEAPRFEPDPAPKPRPSAADAIVLPLWILGGQLLAGVAILPGMIFASDPEGSMSVLIAIAAVLGWSAVAVGMALWLRFRGAWHGEWLTGHRPRSAWLPAAIGVGGAVGGLIVVQVVVGLLSWVTGTEPPEQEIFELLDDPLIAWVMGGLAVLVAPVVEEIIFRGVVLDALARAMNWWVAAVVQAAVFSAIHIETLTSPIMFLALGLLGFAFAWLRRVTGSLVAPIVAHLVFNAISLGLATLVGAGALP